MFLASEDLLLASEMFRNKNKKKPRPSHYIRPRINGFHDQPTLKCRRLPIGASHNLNCLCKAKDHNSGSQIMNEKRFK